VAAAAVETPAEGGCGKMRIGVVVVGWLL